MGQAQALPLVGYKKSKRNPCFYISLFSNLKKFPDNCTHVEVNLKFSSLNTMFHGRTKVEPWEIFIILLETTSFFLSEIFKCQNIKQASSMWWLCPVDRTGDNVSVSGRAPTLDQVALHTGETKPSWQLQALQLGYNRAKKKLELFSPQNPSQLPGTQLRAYGPLRKDQEHHQTWSILIKIYSKFYIRLSKEDIK